MDTNEKKSLLCQTFATAGLLQQLYQSDFLHSDFFKFLPFDGLGTDGAILKNVLLESGIGNPATMLMFLYGLLVMPKELFSENNNIEEELKNCVNAFLTVHSEIIEFKYPSDGNQLNFYRHLRNAVSHAKYTFEMREGVAYVTFFDNNKSEECSFRVSTENMGILLSKIQYKLIELYSTI